MVPNIDGTMGHKIWTRNHHRHGTQCVIEYQTNRNPAQSLHKSATTVFGPQLYNSLPNYEQHIESLRGLYSSKYFFFIIHFREKLYEQNM